MGSRRTFRGYKNLKKFSKGSPKRVIPEFCYFYWISGSPFILFIFVFLWGKAKGSERGFNVAELLIQWTFTCFFFWEGVKGGLGDSKRIGMLHFAAANSSPLLSSTSFVTKSDIKLTNSTWNLRLSLHLRWKDWWRSLTRRGTESPWTILLFQFSLLQRLVSLKNFTPYVLSSANMRSGSRIYYSSTRDPPRYFRSPFTLLVHLPPPWLWGVLCDSSIPLGSTWFEENGFVYFLHYHMYRWGNGYADVELHLLLRSWM
jgi:hypothetical protein